LSDLLIQNGLVVTMDKERRIIEDGAIMIENDRIIDIGKTSEIKDKYKPERVVDAHRKAVLPGLVNLHAHLWFKLYRGAGGEWPLRKRLRKVTWPVTESLTPDDVYAGAMSSILELVKSGATTITDHFYNFHKPGLADRVIKAFEMSGIRGVFVRGIMDMGYEAIVESRKHAIKEIPKQIKLWNGAADGRIQVMIGPVSPFSCSKESYEAARELADKYNVLVCTHISQTPGEVEEIRKKYDKTPLEFLYDMNFTGSDAMLMHCIILTDNDFRILRETESNVVHCPSINMEMGCGLTPVPRLLDEGINVGIGAEGIRQDMMAELRFEALWQRAHNMNPNVLPPKKILEMATINGAKALGLENEIGSIDVGKKADIILIDLNKPYFVPLFDIMTRIPLVTTGDDVDTVIIDGKIIMENKSFEELDEVKVLQRARQVAADLLTRAGIKSSLKGYIP
jgi:5-methylthioadenosine/S-adenosylhomocysteine deaminase